MSLSNNNTHSFPSGAHPGLEVPRWRMSDNNKPFANKILQYGKPIVIENSFIQHWKAASKWNPGYLKNKVKQLTKVYKNSYPYFGPYYDTTRPLSQWTSPSNRYASNVTISSSKFFNHISDESSSDPKHFLYYSGEIERFGKWALDDISPYADLISPMPESSSINVWIGQKGVIAHCHYDGYHNFYVQLRGRKKFTLFPPSSWAHLQVFPFLHPSHAQCQVNVSEIDVSQIPGAQQVVLNAGDVLYLPPLHFHHVEAVDESVSLNVWTDTPQSGLVQAVFAIPFPSLEKLKTTDTSISIATLQAWMALVLIGRVLQHITELDSTVGDFVNQVSSVRFGRLKLQLDEDQVVPWNQDVICSEATQSLAPRIEVNVETYAKGVSRVLNQLPPNTLQLWLGNYVEFVAASLAGPRFTHDLLSRFNDCTADIVKFHHIE